MLGRERLSKAVRDGPLRFLGELSENPRCGTQACRDAFTSALRRQWKDSTFTTGTEHAFYTFSWGDLGNSPPCLLCLTYARGEHEQSQQALWEKLPEMFDMDGWDVLRSESLQTSSSFS
jgi:hypothetical protein